MENQSTIPVEVLCHVFCYLDIRDVVRLRTVSKEFRDISYAPAIWNALYANAHFPRPPGPFPSQSVQFLERTLIKSEQLARSWTTRPMRYGSSVRIRLGMLPTLPSKIIDGRWLIGCEASRSFVVHDLDSETVPRLQRILWVHDVPICGWDAYSVTSSEGPVLYIMFSDATDRNPFLPLKLLEFRVNSDSGYLYHSLSLDVPTKHFSQPECLGGGHGPFLHIGTQNLVFDAETRQFYEFPPFSSALPVGDLPPPLHIIALSRSVTLLTKTHIITLRCVLHNSVPPSQATLVQAFTLPAMACSLSSSPRLLRLSHEGIIQDTPEAVNLIRNSFVDPIGGATNIRLLSQTVDRKHTWFTCLDLTLPKHPLTNMNAVLPITIETQHVLTADEVFSRGRNRDWMCYVEFSDDGYVRGLWQLHSLDPTIDGSIMRFTIDASQKRCSGVLSKLLPSEWRENNRPQFICCFVDGARGKLCYDQREGPTVVVDFE